MRIFQAIALAFIDWNRLQTKGSPLAVNHERYIERIIGNHKPVDFLNLELSFWDSEENKLVFTFNYRHEKNDVFQGMSEHTVTILPNLAYGFTVQLNSNYPNDDCKKDGDEYIEESLNLWLNSKIDPNC